MKKFQIKNSKGYTLIELVIVMIIIIAVGAIIAGIIYSSIRGTTKTRSNISVSQNGNYVVTFLTDFLVNSKKLLSVTDLADDEITYTDCVVATPIQARSVTVQGFDDGITTLSCDDITISSNSASLLNTSQVQVISGTCKFTCFQTDTYATPQIGISFDLQNANTIVPETSGTASFNTTVTLRNFGL